MRKFRSLGAAIVLSVFILAGTITAFGDTKTVKFNDIDTSWAKQNIINVYTKGLMDGITETSFKPKDNVKSYDVIASIARMINGPNTDNLSTYETKYKSSLDEYKVPANYRKEVAFCIEKGILDMSKNDLSSLTNDPNEKSKKLYATKIDVSVYLGRAFGVKINKDIALSYKDAIFIYSDYKSYVDFLAKKGVVSSTGNDKGEFEPYVNITRETFAKMLDVSSGVYESEYKNGQSTAPTNTDNTSNPGSNGSTTSGSTTNNTDTNNTGTGNNGSGTEITVTNPDTVTYSATVDQVIPEYGNMRVYIKESNGTQTQKVYKVADNVVCTIDGASSYYYKLKQGDTISIGVSGDTIYKITSESAVKKLVGTITDMNISDKITLVMQASSGETQSYLITDKTVIIKDGKTVGYQDLNKGNSVVITISNNELVEVNADGVKNSDKGVIESITYSRSTPPKLVISAADGKRSEYFVSRSITADNIIIEGSAGNVYSLRPGMQVSVEVVDDEISSIVTLKTVSNLETRAGIKSINLEARYILVSVYDEISKQNIEKMVFLTNAKIADLELNNLSIDKLKVGQIIRIYGTEDTEGIVAKSIIVEQ